MARKARQTSGTGIYHVMLRGISSVKKHKNCELCIMHYELFCIFAHGQSPKMDI